MLHKPSKTDQEDTDQEYKLFSEYLFNKLE